MIALVSGNLRRFNVNYKEALEALENNWPDSKYSMLIEGLEELKRLAEIGNAVEAAGENCKLNIMLGDKVLSTIEVNIECEKVEPTNSSTTDPIPQSTIGVKTCSNCKYVRLSTRQSPCSTCWKGNGDTAGVTHWEPIG